MSKRNRCYTMYNSGYRKCTKVFEREDVMYLSLVMVVLMLVVVLLCIASGVITAA